MPGSRLGRTRRLLALRRGLRLLSTRGLLLGTAGFPLSAALFILAPVGGLPLALRLQAGERLEGVKRTTAINTNILVTTVPAFTLAIAIVLRRERASLAKVGGIAFAALGAVYLIGPDRIRLDPYTALGNAMIVLNTSLYAA